ncbi:hypothetical protein YC2023_119435 [Brassica napus]
MGKIEEGGEANLLKFLKEKHRVSVQGKLLSIVFTIVFSPSISSSEILRIARGEELSPLSGVFIAFHRFFSHHRPLLSVVQCHGGEEG